MNFGRQIKILIEAKEIYCQIKMHRLSHIIVQIYSKHIHVQSEGRSRMNFLIGLIKS